MNLMFKSRRKWPVLVLTPAMQRDAWLADRNAAALRRNMQEVHRIEAEAKACTTSLMQRGKA